MYNNQIISLTKSNKCLKIKMAKYTLIMVALNILSGKVVADEHIIAKELEGHHWNKGVNPGMML